MYSSCPCDTLRANNCISFVPFWPEWMDCGVGGKVGHQHGSACSDPVPPHSHERKQAPGEPVLCRQLFDALLVAIDGKDASLGDEGRAEAVTRFSIAAPGVVDCARRFDGPIHCAVSKVGQNSAR